jgi:tRNA-dihydrouridine synthase B
VNPPAPTGAPPPAGLLEPLLIGALRLQKRLFMAPMAGITTPAFRCSVRRFGAGLVFTEMISSAGILYGNRRTLEYLECGADEHPIGFQLFGAGPAEMARAAEVCVEAGADLIDLNMACPVRKVVKTGAGAALLAEPEAAAAIVRSVTDAAGDVPVTVKLRAGLRQGDGLGLAVAPRLVDAGAQAVCLHPRYATQLYRGAADHDLTERLCRAVLVPVIASGDVRGRTDCERFLALGAAAVMVARGALGRPWIFQEILEQTAPSPDERLAEVRRFAAEAIASRGERAVGHLRQFWPRFRRSGAVSKETCARLMAARTSPDVTGLLAR